MSKLRPGMCKWTPSGDVVQLIKSLETEGRFGPAELWWVKTDGRETAMYIIPGPDWGYPTEHTELSESDVERTERLTRELLSAPHLLYRIILTGIQCVARERGL